MEEWMKEDDDKIYIDSVDVLHSYCWKRISPVLLVMGIVILIVAMRGQDLRSLSDVLFFTCGLALGIFSFALIFYFFIYFHFFSVREVDHDGNNVFLISRSNIFNKQNRILKLPYHRILQMRIQRDQYIFIRDDGKIIPLPIFPNLESTYHTIAREIYEYFKNHLHEEVPLQLPLLSPYTQADPKRDPSFYFKEEYSSDWRLHQRFSVIISRKHVLPEKLDQLDWRHLYNYSSKGIPILHLKGKEKKEMIEKIDSRYWDG